MLHCVCVCVCVCIIHDREKRGWRIREKRYSIKKEKMWSRKREREKRYGSVKREGEKEK